MHLVNGVTTHNLDISDRGLQYGDGLFETIAVANGQLQFWNRHKERLLAGCAVLKIPAPDIQLLEQEVRSMCESTDKAVLKIIITRGQGGRGYKPAIEADPTRILSLYPWPDYPAEYQQGIKVRLCNTPISVNPVLAGIKHLNRLENVLARMEWNDEGIAEGLLLNTNGLVIEGTMSNIFSVRDNQLLTPDLSECGVNGIIRSVIMDIAKESGLAIQIDRLSLDDVRASDELFFCNSIIGIWPVAEFEKLVLTLGPITSLLQKKLANYLEHFYA